MTYALLAGAYLFGSIPWGVLLTRAFSADDPRRHGSGNIGATNVARVGGLGLGAATLAADMLKGALPVWLALNGEPDPLRPGLFPVLAVLLAFFGHLFPLYTGFRGGGGRPLKRRASKGRPMGWNRKGRRPPAVRMSWDGLRSWDCFGLTHPSRKNNCHATGRSASHGARHPPDRRRHRPPHLQAS